MRVGAYFRNFTVRFRLFNELAFNKVRDNWKVGIGEDFV